MTARELLRLAPEGLSRPGWLLDWARTGRLPGLTVPNMAAPGQPAPTFFAAYGQWLGSPLPTWDDIAWMREQWGGPFMLKGVSRIDDARRAVDAGVTAISVSNHGGNNLDGTPATIRVLPGIARAVGDQVEVLLDGGIRRGGDVVKALALGARAVMIGRAYLWGLAAAGQPGVQNVLDVLRGGIDSALLGLGCESIADLSAADHLVVPPGFARSLGAAMDTAGQPCRADLGPTGRRRSRRLFGDWTRWVVATTPPPRPIRLDRTIANQPKRTDRLVSLEWIPSHSDDLRAFCRDRVTRCHRGHRGWPWGQRPRPTTLPYKAEPVACGVPPAGAVYLAGSSPARPWS